MEVIKVVFFLYALILPVYPSDSGNGQIEQPMTTEYDGNCICYPKSDGLTTVSDIMDPQGEKLERVVIYIYRYMDTNEIKMYTPNKEKQLKIPDLPFEIGDGLVALTKEMSDIFHKNPNIITLSDAHHKVKNNNVVKPIGLMTGDIEEVPNNIDIPDSGVQDNYNNLKGYPDLYSVEETTNKWPKVIDNEKITNVVTISKPWGEIIPNNRPWDDTQKGKYYKNWHHPGENDAYWQIGSEFPNNPNMDIYTPNIETIHNHPSGKPHYLNFNKWFVEQMGRFRHTSLPGDINSIDTAVLRSLLEKTLRENNMYVTTNGILIDSFGTVLDVANLELRPLLLGNSVGYDKILNGVSGKLKLPIDLPYLEGILVTLVYPPKVLGIIPLGKTYLSRLPSGGDGDLSKSNIHKLQIPSIKEDSKFQEKELNKQMGPSVIASLLSRKVTASQEDTNKTTERPVIKHHHAPAKLKRKNLKKNKGTEKSIMKIITVPNNVKTDKPIDRNIVSDKVGFGMQRESNPNTSNILDKIYTIVETDKPIGKNIVSDKLGFGKQRESNVDTRNILDKIYTLVTEAKKKRPDDVTFNEDYDDEDDDRYLEELPDYRIIGGNAATSSGAPVSNRGRSGIDV